MAHDLHKKLIILHLVRKFPAFYGKKFSLPCVQNQATCAHYEPGNFSLRSTPVCLRPILISSHLCLGISYDLFPSGSPTKAPYGLSLSPIHPKCPPSLIIFDFADITKGMNGVTIIFY
jgi:hypothetical protein